MDKQNINIFVISSPSGGGKTSLIKKLLEDPRSEGTDLSISHTTREKRLNEKDGVDYFFTDKKSFDCLLYTSPSPRDVHLSRMPSSA